MFYTYADKWQSTFFGDWRTRTVAFDTRRRYLYYSEPVVVPSTASAAASSASTSPNLRSAGATPGAQPTAVVLGSGAVAPSTNAAAAAEATGSPVGLTNAEHMRQVTQVEWRKKLKVFGVVPVATVKEFKLDDVTLAERDLYRLEITGETRAMATDEIPPVGPLLCPSAGLMETTRRCTVHNEEYIDDPFFLKELFNAMRDQFEELEREKTEAAAAAVAAGRPMPVNPSTTLTVTSPRGPKDRSPRKDKVLLRCRNEREFRRFWYVLQTVLGYDKLITRPYRGLPPYDPRNMVSFAHIPITVWHTFKALDKAVFYVFARGDVMGIADAGNDLAVTLHGCYMCVTHDMIYFMRDTGNIPRWIRLQEMAEFHYNVTAKEPFFAFLCDAPAPDLVFVPLPPVFGLKAASDYDPIFDVRRMQRVMHDTVFASLAIRRVVRLTEVTDTSVKEYVLRTQASRRPLRLHPGTNYSSTMSCPLPKEQLAAVWYNVQQELRAIGDISSRAAIPLYEGNAPDVQLSGAQLNSIEQHLEDERERRDDIVGMPLARAQQVPAVARAITAASHSPTNPSVTNQRHHNRTAARRQSALVTASHLAAAADRSADGVTQVMPLTAEMLHTPQLAGTYQARCQVASPQAGDSRSSSVASNHQSEFSSYLVPGTRYLTREEVEAGRLSGANKMGTSVMEDVAVDRHEEVEKGSTVRGAVGPASCAAGGAGEHRNGGRSSGFLYGPERTVNEIVRESLAALEKQRGE